MSGSEWTCGGCGVAVASLAALEGSYFCLSCRRKQAGGDEARIEFELDRASSHCDTRVARDTGTNVALVRQVRARLGAYPTQPA